MILKVLLCFMKSLYFHVLYIYERHFKWATLRFFKKIFQSF